MKLLIISDVHAGESRESTSHSGIIRQANSIALKELSQLVPLFNQIKPDLVFQMGDLIRETDENNQNRLLFSNSIEVFKQIISPAVHLIGNHELRGLSETDLQNLLPNQSYGLQELEDFQLIWLGVEMKNSKFVFPQDQLNWLGTVIKSNKKILIFSHFSINEQNDVDNFYFDGKPEKFVYANSQEIMNILSDKHVLASFSANAHWAGYKFDVFHHISLPSFSEHIMKSEREDISPGVYVIIEDKNDFLIIKGYSGKFCFLNIELPFEPNILV